jgi:alanyl-tRNA synthetase
MLTANEIRQQFLDFFRRHGHTIVPSSSVVPLDDPTLLFTNAGMNQFKDVFLGTGSRPYRRAADTQKCIRAGGKHNDLDDVGKDTYHQTFFEMLGNWSFGDYFKREAIQWAWELLTKVWGIDKSRLHATVFEGGEGVERDQEAFDLWRTLTDIDPTHIHWGNKKDNFWEMGETGPCGPCSEIHYDRTPDGSGGALVNKGSPDVIEIWNLVFIQYNRGPDGVLTPLPAKHVDTGMGFERITSVLQGKTSNYDTDIFAPIFDAIQEITGAEPYSGILDDLKDTAYRVIADHIRALTFSLTDGAVPGNKDRGYVVRSILRRAERFGRQYLKTKEPFLYRLVLTVVELMGPVFPELRKDPKRVIDVIVDEEKSFLRTLDRGIRMFQDVVRRTRNDGSTVISGEDTFDLHTTYGVFPDITQQMAEEVGMAVDMEDYKRRMGIHIDTSGEGRERVVISAVSGELPRTDESPKYRGTTAASRIVGWVKDNRVVESDTIVTGEEGALLLERTCFYAEQGGQVGDTGRITTETGWFKVTDTQRLMDCVLHIGQVMEGRLNVGQVAEMEVGGDRIHTMRNHTATHLLNWALRRVLGDHVDQKGSLVDHLKTRFDFSHDKPLTAGEIAEIERLVNELIQADLPVTAIPLPLGKAKKIPGVRAMFGEKYPDPVRVVMIGPESAEDATPDYSVEFCGGTHLHHSGEAGFFKITSQELVAKGVRRVVAVTGTEAVRAVQEMSTLLADLGARFNCKPDELPARIASLQEEVKKLQKQLEKGTATDLASAADKLLADALDVGGAKIIIGEMPAGPKEQMLAQADRLRQKAGSAVIALGWVEDGKVQLLAAVSEDLVERGGHAGNLIKEIAPIVGGKGGGKPTMAQAGGKDPSKLADALRRARELAAAQLK